MADDDVSLLQTHSIADSSDVFADSENYSMGGPYDVTEGLSHTCHRKHYWADGAKIVTCKDVKHWDTPEWGKNRDKRRGIVALTALECEEFCKEFDECNCWIFDLNRKRCNLKNGCTGAKGRNKWTRSYLACKVNRQAAKQCTKGPEGKPCRGGCVAHGMEPHCICAAPGSICPKPGVSGKWCEEKDPCYEKKDGDSCGGGKVCKTSTATHGLRQCVTQPACTKGPGGKPCLNGGVAQGKEPNCVCKCPDGYGGANCETPLPCTTGPQGKPCLNGGTPTGTTGSCKCQCINRFTGDWCEIDPVFGTIKGNPIVFIIDKSGSMGFSQCGHFDVDGKTYDRDSYVTERLGIVMSGLTNANLPNKTWFNVISFANEATRVFAGKNVEATAANINHAHTTIAAVAAKGSTYAEAALAMAFTMDPGAIYFLTDGQPNDRNTGNRDTSDIILKAVPGWENQRNIPVNSIGVFAGRDTGTTKAVPFLKSLAEMTGGDLTEVH